MSSSKTNSRGDGCETNGTSCDRCVQAEADVTGLSKALRAATSRAEEAESELSELRQQLQTMRHLILFA